MRDNCNECLNCGSSDLRYFVFSIRWTDHCICNKCQSEYSIHFYKVRSFLHALLGLIIVIFTILIMENVLKEFFSTTLDEVYGYFVPLMLIFLFFIEKLLVKYVKWKCYLRAIVPRKE